MNREILTYPVLGLKKETSETDPRVSMENTPVSILSSSSWVNKTIDVSKDSLFNRNLQKKIEYAKRNTPKNIYEMFEIIHDIAFYEFCFFIEKFYIGKTNSIYGDFSIYKKENSCYQVFYKSYINDKVTLYNLRDSEKVEVMSRFQLAITMHEEEVIFIEIKKQDYTFDKEAKPIKTIKSELLDKYTIRYGKHRQWCIKERCRVGKTKKKKLHTKKRNIYQNRYVSLLNASTKRTLSETFKILLVWHNEVQPEFIDVLKYLHSYSVIDRRSFSNKDIFRQDIQKFIARKYGTIIPKKLIYIWAYKVKRDFSYLINLFDEKDWSLVYENIKEKGSVFRIDNPNQINSILLDTLSMANQLNRKLSPRIQSVRRLREIHDELSVEHRLKEIVDFEVDKNYHIIDFLIPEWELIKDKKRLMQEGAEQHNCVTSYANKIADGDCAIFSMVYGGKRYTIEVTKKVKVPYIYNTGTSTDAVSTPSLSVGGGVISVGGGVIHYLDDPKQYEDMEKTLGEDFRILQFKGQFNKEPPRVLVEYYANIFKNKLYIKPKKVYNTSRASNY